eukprot:54399-Rhodomonas_salina.3
MVWHKKIESWREGERNARNCGREGEEERERQTDTRASSDVMIAHLRFESLSTGTSSPSTAGPRDGGGVDEGQAQPSW